MSEIIACDAKFIGVPELHPLADNIGPVLKTMDDQFREDGEVAAVAVFGAARRPDGKAGVGVVVVDIAEVRQQAPNALGDMIRTMGESIAAEWCIMVLPGVIKFDDAVSPYVAAVVTCERGKSSVVRFIAPKRDESGKPIGVESYATAKIEQVNGLDSLQFLLGTPAKAELN